MAARSIYLRVTELLRAHHDPITRVEHRHSSLALQLRTNVLDSELQLQSALAYAVGWAAVHGTSNVDHKAAFGLFRKLYGDALGTVPYLTGGKSGEELMQSDRMRAIERFRVQREQTLKRKGGEPRDTETAQPVGGHRLFGAPHRRERTPADEERAARKNAESSGDRPWGLFGNKGLERRV